MEFKIGKDSTRITENIRDLEEFLGKRRALFVISKNIDEMYGKIFGKTVSKIKITDGEAGKTMLNLKMVVKKLIENEFDKGDAIVGVGGGTVLDLTGLVASIYKRGMVLVNVPTTLLGMVDAAYGGKNGINFMGIKNVLGTFYHPGMIYLHYDFIASLNKRQILSGLGEVVKYAIISDGDLFMQLTENYKEILNKNIAEIRKVVHRSLLIKYNIVKDDVYGDLHIRDLLNAGHTLGHAYESVSNFRIPHGIAVLYGLRDECRIQQILGLTDAQICEEIEELMIKLRIEEKLVYKPQEIMSIIKNDKKIRGATINFPLIREIGRSEIIEVKMEDFENALFKIGSCR